VTDAPRVALTFDVEHPDRPHHGAHAEWVLDELARAEVPATLFLQGRWVEAHPELARRAAVDGHLIGNHSHYHVRMPLLSPSGFDEDVRTAETVIRDVTGADPRPWFRFPFGAGADDADLHERLDALEYRHVGWDVELYEWEPGRTPREIADAVVNGVAARDDDTIVLLHSWPDPVAPGLADAIGRLRDRGARFVRIDALELVAAPAQPVPGEPAA
jgi:peptidoglycan-N-acetylglucosamine deacetylase